MQEIILRKFSEDSEEIFLHSTSNARAELERLQQTTRQSLGNYVNELVQGLSRDYWAAILGPLLQRLSAAQVKIRHDVREFIKEADAQLHLDEVKRQIHQELVPIDDA